jgi:hypothetical protein
VWNITDDAKIFIEFDAIGCPLIVNPPDLYINKGKKVQWQAVGADGANIPEVYEIFFEPFKGMKLKSGGIHGPGKIISNEIAGSAAQKGIEFKYTVVGDRCPGKPLDPRFRLR